MGGSYIKNTQNKQLNYLYYYYLIFMRININSFIFYEH